MSEPDRARARRLAGESLARGDAVGWFEEIYVAAAGEAAQIPWADQQVNPNLAQWLARGDVAGHGRRALVVGCGLGDDAEALAACGFQVTAFDVSAAAIDWCRRRFPDSAVDYEAADLLHPPAAWHGAFDLVVEIYTLQVLPPELRAQAMAHLASFVARGGTLLVVARGREEHDEPGSMPWPLTTGELRRPGRARAGNGRVRGLF